MGVVTVVVVALMLPEAGIILLVGLVLAATVVPWVTGRLARRAEGALAPARGRLAESLVDLVEGGPELEVHGATADQLARVAAADDELRSLAARSAAAGGVGLALITALTGLAMWGDTAVGIAAVHSGRLDGTLLAVIALIPLAAFEIVVTLPGATQAWQRARHTAGRVFDVLDAPDPMVSSEHLGPLPAGPRPIVGSAVTARYPRDSRDALRGVDLAVGPGRRVAVVGPSGAGKTTLAHVLVAFLPYGGSLTAAGVELRGLVPEAVRSAVGLVTQDPHVFDTTVATNVRIGNAAAGDDEVRAALDRVGLGPWLDSLPDGLDSATGSRGARLSGGQRQRLGVARAVLARFDVLILDEPTEHLDLAAADALVADLVALDVGPSRSLVLVTHRLAGLEHVDEILVMEEGLVVERGTHHALVGAAGRYRRLWDQECSADGRQSPQSGDAGDRAAS